MVMAVTGEVGAGKSTVAGLLEAEGGFLIDADRVVAELWRTKELIDAAAARWGDAVLEAGRVSHKEIAARIFRDKAEYDWTMALLHPKVSEELERRASLPAARCARFTVLEIPLLFESGVPAWVTATVFVTASRPARLKRCQARGWDEPELTRRESFFMSTEKRIALADRVIQNDGTPDDLKKSVKAVLRKLIKY